MYQILQSSPSKSSYVRRSSAPEDSWFPLGNKAESSQTSQFITSFPTYSGRTDSISYKQFYEDFVALGAALGIDYRTMSTPSPKRQYTNLDAITRKLDDLKLEMEHTQTTQTAQLINTFPMYSVGSPSI
uniref:VP4 n=1 Tax=Steinernema glaseri TaxID=37863 RepID=A0A1I7Z759_9BILA